MRASAAQMTSNDQSAEAPSPAGEPFPVVRLMGVRLHAATEDEVNQHIVRSARGGVGGIVITPNLDHLRRAVRDHGYRAMIEHASLSVPDGFPLVLASRIQGTPLPARVAGSDLISSLSAQAAGAGLSVFLLGGDPGTAERAGEVLRERHPGLVIAGTYCPPMGFERDAAVMEEMKRMLRESRAQIVFVALGSPKQERLIAQVRGELPHAWWLGVGISFSFLCGEVPRAPRWMRRCGLEWFHRLISEPRRLFRRYLIEGIPFAARLLLHSLRVRFFGRRRPPGEPMNSACNGASKS